MQHQTQVERRPRPRTRRPNDGIGKTVEPILARWLPSCSVGLAGCACMLLPIANGMAGESFWPFVVAYGGCLVGIALMRGVQR